MKITTRFAPSPTGSLHVGSIRIALISWLFARNKGGNFVFRFEDINSNVSSKKFINLIIKELRWIGINWDQGPYFQSSRLLRYNKVIDYMLKKKLAYKCFCSEERLFSLRNKQISLGEKPRYDSFCRNLKKNNDTKKHVVRFCNPLNGSISFYDKIKGLISFNNNELDDLIIRRSNGLPTYNFCVIIDDYDMKITHVIRGDDHISNTPRQINMLKSLDFYIPFYAHIPMVLNIDKTKISKRNQSLGIFGYKNLGYLPEALLNYIYSLGYSINNKEIFNINYMKHNFQLKKVGKSSCIFDIKKLQWYNHNYLRSLSKKKILKYLTFCFKKNNIDLNKGPNLLDIVTIFSVRCKTLQEIVDNCKFLYKYSLNFLVIKDYLNKFIYFQLCIMKLQILKIKDWSILSIKKAIYIISKRLLINFCVIMMFFRVLIIGFINSPPINLIIYIFGKEKTILKINKAITLVK